MLLQKLFSWNHKMLNLTKEFKSCIRILTPKCELYKLSKLKRFIDQCLKTNFIKELMNLNTRSANDNHIFD
jgi:hypothetical protein